MIWLFYECGIVDVAYAYNGKCSSICDAICGMTRVAPGSVLKGRDRGTLEGMREKFGVGNMAFIRVRGGKVEVPYAYNGECSSICDGDAICDRTGVAPGVVL